MSTTVRVYTGHSGEIGTLVGNGATVEGNALLARFHKGHGRPKAEFAALMSIAGYASFDAACDAWDAAPVEPGGDFGRFDPQEIS